ncbi:hypothetical protein R3P38DRAFT_3537872 [Favolaschia claudopus]|uniref:Uncharacterized protein n=1 Tax=Favolaschia claudopus TaxID=2862362 RepID=A0AAW0BB89_9AGAR
MTAFPVKGVPSVSFIGTNESDLTWTVKYPVGTKLVLGVVDSHGTSGGIDPGVYTVIGGGASDCLPSPPSDTSFKITANVTDALDTCQPWGLTIEGGFPPYQVTIATLNSGNVTNVTFADPLASSLTYINRSPPGNQMFAAASDVYGRWANGIPFVRTQGSQDTGCIGLVTSAALGAILISGAIFATFLLRRRRKGRPKRAEITPFSRESNPGGLYAARATSKIAPSSCPPAAPEPSPPDTSGTMVFASPTAPHPDLAAAELPPPYPQ